MVAERRNFDRIQFGRGYVARIMAIDGTWHRDCRIGDVSDTGAKLTVHGSVDDIDIHEFFLVLSATGNAHRRCERVWLNGDELGVRFLKDVPGKPRRDDWKQTDSHDEVHEPGVSE
jgi:PilZ domain-containing protein